QDGTGFPLEYLYGSIAGATQYRFVIFKDSAAQNRVVRMQVYVNGTSANKFQYVTAGQTYGHCAAANAFGVAATNAIGAYPGVFNSATKVENFSSDGMRRIFYNAD